jgi:hypothetical protein
VGNTTLEVYNNRYLLRRYFKNEELRIFHCLFIVLKISLFSMPSCHDPVTGIFLCLFIVFEISCSPCHPVTIQWPERSFLFSLFSKSHCSPCHPVTIQWPKCSILLLFSKSLCFPCHPVIQSRFSDRNVPFSYHCFQNFTVLHAIQSRSSDRNIPLSCHCFENLTVLRVIIWLTLGFCAKAYGSMCNCHSLSLHFRSMLCMACMRNWLNSWTKIRLKAEEKQN